MKIEHLDVTVRDLVEGYKDGGEDGGVVGYGGLLNIRPKFQREFIYKPDQQVKVIETVIRGFPLNAMYWIKSREGYELLDGQQRTVSICRFVAENAFSIVQDDYPKTWRNLTADRQERILSYPLMVYLCEGDDDEKLGWFRVINTQGEKLTDQEMNNAIYAGPFVEDAKRYFSRQNQGADLFAEGYVSARVNRQELLEKALKWRSGGDVSGYMNKHRNDPNASELWLYFQGVINWAKITFPVKRKELTGVDWGELYRKYGDKIYDADALEREVSSLMEDEDVTNKKGIYYYVLSREERYLSIRTFNERQKRQAYERQGGICPVCGEHFDIDEMEADHIVPWSQGGRTVDENCRMLCKKCHNAKTARQVR